MNNIISKLFTLFILILSSCNNNAQEKITFEVLSKTNLPLKVKVGEQKLDSIPTLFYIPLEFKYINNSNTKLKIKQTFWSEDSPNTRSSTVYFKNNDNLAKGIRTKFLEQQQQEHCESFVRFELLLSRKEFKKLFKKEIEENSINNFKFSTDLRSFLSSKIVEKGYLISIFFDLENKENIIIKIPLDF